MDILNKTSLLMILHISRHNCKGQYIINEIVFYNYLKLYTLNIYTKNKEIYITLDIYIKKVYILFIYTNIKHIYSLLTIFQHKKKYPPALVSCFPHAFQLYYFRYIVIPTTNPIFKDKKYALYILH